MIQLRSVLPGLRGAAECGVGSSPDENIQPCVQQEDEAAKKKKIQDVMDTKLGVPA